MRTSRAEHQAKLERVAQLIRDSGGLSVWQLSKLLGMTPRGVNYLVDYLRVDGVVDYSDEFEPKEKRKGPAARLLKVVRQ